MTNRLRYVSASPEGYARLGDFGHYLNTKTTLSPVLKAMIDLRVSQINHCEYCMQLHADEMRKHNEPETRIAAVEDFRNTDAFTPREKAALAWAETLTLLPESHRATEEEYAAISEFFQGKDLADLTYVIAAINAWNRIGVAFRPQYRGLPSKSEPSVH
ncbi:MAG: carboxymuconolactone decarboxylase family protein [Acidobacteriaceae bacterium]|nr:carboxymuconolactone decarboxylase family protein [Acidobacteriaceae bacterium]